MGFFRYPNEISPLITFLFRFTLLAECSKWRANVKPSPRHFEHASQDVLFKISVWHGEISCYYKLTSNVPGFRRYAFSPSSCKTKGERWPCAFGRGIVLPFSKTQPVRFWLLCVVGMSQLPWSKGLPWSGKNRLLFLLAFKRKSIQFWFVVNSTIVVLWTFPLIAAGAYFFSYSWKETSRGSSLRPWEP